tara:strand:+ start:453 stop:584 length:132 start_codon:yes stop_codon:yes gene_type:complete
MFGFPLLQPALFEPNDRKESDGMDITLTHSSDSYGLVSASVED